ncbi:MAG: hypothetical protein A3D28_03115 [Omnitrophica bacterium RIFCSPHIGHO2_02_FULL_63_14]|nr:MAG: hypothetical protein A3D28_03115 [Omnitrophica bacterium RIFCSPHIGHO2_02_FULL_63_14]
MEFIQEFFSRLQHLDQLIAWAGYAGLTAIVFCETGLLAGFFLPGDSLLVTAGLVASQGKLNIWTLNALLGAAAVLGDTAGYWIGYHMGARLFRKEESFFFRKSHLRKTEAFFEKYGAKTIVIARFVPIVRTFAPTVAGAAGMRYRRFLSFNVFGGVLWVVSMTSIGYFLGSLVPHIDRYLHVVVAVVIILSFLPILIEYLKSRR